jgi:transcriptional regulator with XRE-family HTH domain
MTNKHTYQNELAQARWARRLSVKRVAAIINKDSSTITRYEQGLVLPPFETALELEILYRTPVSFLFPAYYDALRLQLRSREEKNLRIPPADTEQAKGGRP